MRFSADFWQARTLEAASYYIAYDELKKDLKHASGPQGNHVDSVHNVRSRLIRQRARHRQYFETELNELQKLCERANEISAAWSLSPHPSKQPAEDSAVTERILDISRAAFLGLHERVSNLLLFGKANEDATLRLLVKLQRAEGESAEELAKNSPLPQDPNTPEALRLEAVISHRLHTLPESSRSPDASDVSAQELVDKLLLPVREVHGDHESTLSWLIQLADFHLKQKAIENSSDDGYKGLWEATNAWEDLIRPFVEQLTTREPRSSVSITAESLHGRSPLHYAAILGITGVIVDLLASGHPGNHADSIGLLPIHLAACNGHSEAVRQLLPALSESFSNHLVASETVTTVARQLVVTGDVDTLREVLASVNVVNASDDNGHNLLCEAVRVKACNVAALLLKYGADPNVIEKSIGMTPLTIAASTSNVALVQLLLERGATVDMADAQGWTPMEHAAYRGHLEIVRVLEGHETSSIDGEGVLKTRPSRFRKDAISSHIPWLQENRGSEDAYVWITLGSIDVTAQTPAIELYRDLDGKPAGDIRRPRVIYTLSVTVGDAVSNKEYSYNLPVIGSRINEPCFFRTRSSEDTTVRWELRGKYTRTSAVATGYTILNPKSSGLQSNKESLVRGATTVLQSSADRLAVGTVNFSYHIVTPHPPPPRLRQPTFWQFGDGIGGHRGSGKNRIAHKQLQLGENTAQSFLTAIEHGASFLEFDIQVTEDLVPVVYHDFLLSETGTDARMQDLSFDQFEYISQAQDPRPARGKRSLSLGADDHKHLDALAARMERTTFNKINGFKANTRGQFIHEKVCSLEHIFNAVPKTIPMNIELKYPMLFECDEWDMEPSALKVDDFASIILDKIYEHMEGRMIVLSTFNPELCIALSTKQRTLPVFFLSKTSAPKGEVRSESVQQAVHFARSWGLPGIVVECTPLAKCPRLIPYVQSAGLAITSFGAGNSGVDNAKAQFDAGIDAVITDSVGTIVRLRKELGKDSLSGTRRIYPTSGIDG